MLETTTKLDAEAAVAALKEAVEAQGLRVAGEINGQANAAMIGAEVPVDRILEVFHPRYALRVWEACKPAGIDIPLRIHVWSDGEQLHVTARRPSEVFAPWGSAELDALGAELDPLFEAIVARLPEVA
ncbi:MULTISPECIES: DUF302 domain-containing protein [unclassified Thioalkalivibrio]|uniref:DUF302 domain-containing protein n=1 Tax=unclassified Thioalkalivibrio TaxID=2621013 RepID=UPI000377BA64|nr:MULTISPECIES: DUF302 domain-containing protein [unclassified Thioalkalivibrio]